jgi:hypothetical protein
LGKMLKTQCFYIHINEVTNEHFQMGTWFKHYSSQVLTD